MLCSWGVFLLRLMKRAVLETRHDSMLFIKRYQDRMQFLLCMVFNANDTLLWVYVLSAIKSNIIAI